MLPTSLDAMGLLFGSTFVVFLAAFLSIHYLGIMKRYQHYGFSIGLGLNGLALLEVAGFWINIQSTPAIATKLPYWVPWTLFLTGFSLICLVLVTVGIQEILVSRRSPQSE